jgi:restriction system protein
MYPYWETIRNEYLGVSKTIKARTLADLNWLIEVQVLKWREQARKKREREEKQEQRKSAQLAIENMRVQAEEDTREAQEKIKSYQSILVGSLGRQLKIDWEKLQDHRPFPPFTFDHPKPDFAQISLSIRGPEPQEDLVSAPYPENPSVWEFFLPFLKKARMRRNQEAEEAFVREQKKNRLRFLLNRKDYRARKSQVIKVYNSQVVQYRSRLTASKRKYAKQRADFLARQENANAAMVALRTQYEEGIAEGIERYMEMILQQSSYPENISGDSRLQFDDPSKILVVNFCLPGLSELPNISEFRFIQSRRAIEPKEMKPKEFSAFYDDVIHQIALRTIREIFTSDYANQVHAVVFNGWVRGVDNKTGKPFTSCILSCEAPREEFMAFDLANVSPRECVRGLKGISAGPLSELAPVKPIMDLTKDDDRFVESKEVLDVLRPRDNLAAMEWEDFEHLIRELFEKEFAKSGGEVRVTQASRDRGVDAIAFDPDPIRGGKFVIQAKRYNMVVPVSAVRDLYGTMIKEGAAKGIIVTTSYYGRDSREFAKGLPITLLDGANLVHLFQKHGYNLHINLLPKGDPRRGLGVIASS